MKAKISQRDPTQSSDRDMIYQVGNWKNFFKMYTFFVFIEISLVKHFLNSNIYYYNPGSVIHSAVYITGSNASKSTLLIKLAFICNT